MERTYPKPLGKQVLVRWRVSRYCCCCIVAGSLVTADDDDDGGDDDDVVYLSGVDGVVLLHVLCVC